jgi:hypothetical protein
MTDDGIDRLVQQASDRPVDIGRLQSRVMTRLRVSRRDGLFGWLQGPALMVPAAFAAVLVAIPVLMAGSPGDAAEGLIAAAALGDPLLADPDLSALLGVME